MINNDKFIETLMITNGLPPGIVEVLKRMNFLDSKFALKDMIKNYRLCFKEKEDVYLSILADLCLIDRHNFKNNNSLRLMGGWEIFNTYGTPCYDWGMICKYSGIDTLTSHVSDITLLLQRIKNGMVTHIHEANTECEEFTDYNGFRLINSICEHMATPILINKHDGIKLNNNYKIVEYEGGMLLVNTEYGYDQWVKVGFPIGNVYVSFYNLVLTGFGDKDTIIIRREYQNKIYENLRNCYKTDVGLMEHKITGHFINGERFIKLAIS